jgi:hypothetical protein
MIERWRIVRSFQRYALRPFDKLRSVIAGERRATRSVVAWLALLIWLSSLPAMLDPKACLGQAAATAAAAGRHHISASVCFCESRRGAAAAATGED